MTINDGADQMYAYCSQHYYWEAIENIFIKYFGCKIQNVEYNEKPQVVLRLTNKDIIIFVDFKLLSGRFNPSYLNMEIGTLGERVSIEADVIKWENNEPWMLYMSWDNDDTKEVFHKKVVEEILNFLKPVCIGSGNPDDIAF